MTALQNWTIVPFAEMTLPSLEILCLKKSLTKFWYIPQFISLVTFATVMKKYTCKYPKQFYQHQPIVFISNWCKIIYVYAKNWYQTSPFRVTIKIEQPIQLIWQPFSALFGSWEELILFLFLLYIFLNSLHQISRYEIHRPALVILIVA